LQTQHLIEPLSERELEVLHLIAAGLSNREIAERLVISLSTVKGHIANIYSKLAVNSRTQAVAAATALGLLADIPANQPRNSTFGSLQLYRRSGLMSMIQMPDSPELRTMTDSPLPQANTRSLGVEQRAPIALKCKARSVQVGRLV